MPPLRIGIDARLFSGKSGGIEQVAIGLVNALSQLSDGEEEYLILTYPLSREWIEPYIKGRCRMLVGTGVEPAPPWKRLLKKWPALTKAGQHVGGWPARRSVTLSKSDGTIERAGVEVMHFIMQRAFFTSVPSLYHPHDLQHVHLPEFFSRRERVKRDIMLRAFCNQASLVPVTSTWIRDDLIHQYGLAESKVAVVELLGALGAYPTPLPADLLAAKTKFDLPEAFVFYPAQTWPHKNHLALLEAIALLRDRQDLVVPLVCCGGKTEYFATLQAKLESLGLSRQVQFVGFVSPLELQCLYRLCRGVVIPTLFEAASGPLGEAFMAGAAAACSNVTSLPRQAGDAALVFNPRDVPEMSRAILQLWTDEALRRSLVEKGRANIARFSWGRTARHFRAWYRKIGGRELSAEDRAMLGAVPML